MAGNPELLGSLAVEIIGDYSPLQQAIQEAQSAATAGGEAIAQAFAVPDNADATAQMQALSSAIEGTGAEATAAAAQVADLGDQVEPLGAAATEAGDAVTELGAASTESAGSAEQLGSSVQAAGESAQEAESPFAGLLETISKFTGITLGVEGLKELGTEALTAYSSVQTATIALTALEGSAAKANATIEGLEALANTDALSFPSLLAAAQRMIAFGFAAEQVPAILNAAANAAAATGNNFDMVTNAIDRMGISGTAGARQLASLGLSLNDLAAAMGVDASEVAADFKAMDPSDRIVIIEEALGKYAGVAQLTAQSIAGQWQQLQNAAHQAFVSIGSDIAPAASAIMSFAQDSVIPAASSTIAAFASVVTSATAMVQELHDLGITAGDLLGPLGSLYGYVQSLAGGSGFPSLSSTIVENITHWGALKAMMTDVSLVIETYTNKGPAIDQMNALIAKDLDSITHSATTTSAAYIEATTATVQYNSALLAAVKSQSDAVATLNANKAALDALTQSYQNQTEVTKGHIATLGDIARAQSAVDTATQQLVAHGKNWADTLAGVTDAANVSAEKEQSLAIALQQAQAGFDAGTVSTGLFIDVYNKAQAAAKALGDTLIGVEAEEVKLNQASVNAQITYGAEKKIFADLMLKYEAGIIDLTELEAGYKNLQKAADAAGTSAYNQAAAMLAAVDAAGKQDAALKDNITTLGGLATASIQTTEVQQAQATLFKTITSEASAMGLQITNLGGVYEVTAKHITPAIQSVIDQLTGWMKQAGLTVAAMQQGFGVIQDATTGITTYTGGVERATTALQSHVAAHTQVQAATKATADAWGNFTQVLQTGQGTVYLTSDAQDALANAMSGGQTATNALNAAQNGLITTLQVGDSVITTTTDAADQMATAYNNVAAAAQGAATAVEGFNTASSQTSGIAGGGGASGISEIAGIASMMKMMGATSGQVTSFMGASGFVSQNYSGNDFQSVADYNASITALAKELNYSTITTLDQFGNQLTALGEPLTHAATTTKASTTATITATTAVTALSTAAASAAAATTTAATTSATAAATVATASTTAAAAIAQASTTVSNAAVAAAVTALQVIQAVSPSNAQTGQLMNSAGLNIGSLTMAPSASGGNALVATVTPGTGQSMPYNNSAPLQLVVNLNGGMVVGQNGMTQLTQMIMPQVTTLLRQAGAKV